MPIQFTCSCGQAMTVEDEHAGAEVVCPHCGRLVTAPVWTPSDEQGAGFAPGPEDYVAEMQARGLRRQARAALWLGLAAMVLEFLTLAGMGLLGFAVEEGVVPQGPEGPVALAAGLGVLVLMAVNLVLAALAIVFGFLGARRGNVRNRGSAIFGIVLGFLSLFAMAGCVGLSVIIALVAAA